MAATLSSRIAHDPGDPVLNTWILWWNAQAVPFTSAWWNPPIMWPMPGAIALSEHLVGLSVFATPLQLAGVSPVAAYNVCLILTYTLSAIFMYLLVRRLAGSRLAAAAAGFAFGFCPYRASQMSHVQVLASQWMPLMLLGMHAYLEAGATRWLVVFGAAWLLQALSNGYYMLFLPVLIVMWLAWFVDWRTAPRRGVAIVVAWIVASLPLVPVLLKYRAIHTAFGLRRNLGEIRDFSAVPSSFMRTPELLAFWPEAPHGNYEKFLFLGVTVVVLAAVGLVMQLWRSRGPVRAIRERSPLIFYAAAAIAMCVLALGPGGRYGPPSPWRPYTWLLLLPGYDGLRVPARFAMLASLCLAVAAGIAMSVLSRPLGRWRAVLAVLVFGGLAVDGMNISVPLIPLPGRIILPGPPQAAVIELPTDDRDVSLAAMYRSTFHRQPLVNAYSGHTPPYYRVLSLSLWRGDTSGLLFLARGRPLVIIVKDSLDKGNFRKMVEGIPGIQPQGISAAGSMFLLPPQPPPRRPPLGPPLQATPRNAEHYHLELDLGRPQLVMSLTFPLRWHYEELAERLLVESSNDGQNWHEEWRGWTGGLAIEAVLQDPSLAEIQIPLPAVTARYIRIYPSAPWMFDSLKLH